MALVLKSPSSTIETNDEVAEKIETSVPQQPQVKEAKVGMVGKILGRKEAVNHPSHYGGKDNPYEAIKVIRAWELSFSLGNTVKYIARAGKKDPSKKIEDLHKAMWYLQEEISNEYEKNNK